MTPPKPINLPLPIRLGAQLLLSAFTAALGGAVSVSLGGGLPLGLLLGVGAGFGITLPLQWALWRLEAALQAQPLEPVSQRWNGVLGDLVNRVNLIIIRQRDFDSLREGLTHQTSQAAAQTERNRLARDLHDSIKQQVFAIQLSAAATESLWDSQPVKAKETLADVRRSAHEALVEMNALLQQLSPAPLEKVGLVQALKDQCEALGYRTGAEVLTEFGDLPPDDRLPLGAQESLFRIAQEALSNVARHARAKKVWVRLGLDAGSLKMEVRDDGQGFELESVMGMGLNNIRARVKALRGTVQVMSAPDQGTTLSIQLPLVEPVVEEEIMKADHTLNKVLLSGVGGGLLLTAVLYYPLYALVPAAFVAGWGEGSAALGLAAQALGLLLCIGIGYGAARWAKATTRLDGLVFGALAGTAAGMVAYLGLGAAAAGVVGGGVILQHGLVPAANESEMTRLVIEAVRDTLWWESGALWATLIAGAGLGSVGGGLSPLSQREVAYPWWYLQGSVVLVAMLLVYTLTSTVALTIFPNMDQAVVKALIKNGITLSSGLPVLGGLLLAVLTPLAFYYAALVALYGVLRTHTQQKELSTNLSKVLLVDAMASAFLGGLLALGMAFMTILIWPSDLSPTMKAVFIVHVLLNLISAIPFLRLGLAANRRWRVLNNDTSSWWRDLLPIFVLAGIFEIVWALINALSIPTFLNISVLGVSVLIEAGLLFWLSRLPRSSMPMLTRAMLMPTIVPRGVSTLLGAALVMFASLTAVVPAALALVMLTINLLPTLAGTAQPGAVNFTLPFLVQTYFITQLNLLLVALAVTLSGAALGTLLIWGIGAVRSKGWERRINEN